MNLWIVAFAVLILNLPFGYWRENITRLSLQWLLAIHLPIPVVVALRIFGGLGWELITFPVLVGAFLCGQYLGGMLYRWRKRRASMPVTSCLVMDLTRQVVATFASEAR